MYIRLLSAIAVIAMCSGCVSFGPKSLDVSSTKYSNSLQDEETQQLLLNLVRMRYGEQPLFVEVPQIVQQYSYTGFGEFHTIPDLFISGGSTSDTPVIMYAPRTDKPFYEQLNKPVSLEVMSKLVYHGWDIGMVFRLMTSYMNDLENGNLATRPWAPPADNEAFKELCRDLRQMQLQGMVEAVFMAKPRHKVSDRFDAEALTAGEVLAAAKDDLEFQKASMTRSGPEILPVAGVAAEDKVQLFAQSRQAVVLRFRPDVVGTPEHLRITEMLQMKEPAEYYEMEGAPEGVLRERNQPREKITVLQRSPLEMMFFLSHSVNVPAKHIEACVVDQNACYNHFVNDLFCVRVQEKKPLHAEVSVKYRGHWFYIPQNDLTSRYTLSFLTEIYAADVRGGVGGSIPLFTIGN